MNSSGRLYVFEGPDGTSKLELCRFLVKHLAREGVKCELLSFPSRETSALGEHVYQLHQNTTQYGLRYLNPASSQLLHVAAHIDTIERCILPALKKGRTIVLDCFWWSTKVYGAVKKIKSRLLNSIIVPELIVWGKVQPDALFLIQRNTPLRTESLSKWRQRHKIYERLVDEQAEKYPIYSINDESFEDAKAQVLSAYAGEMSRERRSARQLPLVFGSSQNVSETPYIFSPTPPLRPTIVFDTYWKFATERQTIFFKRLNSSPPPWTDDPTLVRYKFTNAYRASDRVSQFLLKNVIYKGEDTPEEVFFRTLLFKFFNKIETWQLLADNLENISYADYSFERYDKLLSAAISTGRRIYSAAYIMPSGSKIFNTSRKHRAHLKLLERMMEDEVPFRLAEAKTMEEGFKLLRSYPLIGDFLAYQFITDINYSPITNFSEMEFVVPGPGAFSGIHKCFESLGGLKESEIIRLIAEHQEDEFTRRGLNFRSLWGRSLQLIDCQNLFCEVDKYARVNHPEIIGISRRTRIKQSFSPNAAPIDYWYPPKWGLNEEIRRYGERQRTRK